METLEAKTSNVETFGEKEPGTARLAKTVAESDDLKARREALKARNLASKKAEKTDSKEKAQKTDSKEKADAKGTSALTMQKNTEKLDPRKSDQMDSGASKIREKPETKMTESDSNSGVSVTQRAREKSDLRRSYAELPRKQDPDLSSQAQSLAKAKPTISSGHGYFDEVFASDSYEVHRDKTEDSSAQSRREKQEAAHHHDYTDVPTNRAWEEAAKKKAAAPPKPVVKKKSKKNLIKNIKNMTEMLHEFQRAGQKPVIVDCHASWCGPCILIAPKFREWAEKYQDNVVCVKVDVDEAPDVSANFNVSQLPTFLVCMNGELVYQRSDSSVQHLESVFVQYSSLGLTN